MAQSIYENIEQIIPHRPPMIMIDRYRKIDSNTACSGMQFTPGHYGCENGYVTESILIECVAQTVAAHYGYKSLGEEKNEAVVGMLTSVDTFVFHGRVKETAAIDILVSKTDEIGPFKFISGEISIDSKIVAKGQIKIFNPGEMVDS